MCVCVYHCTELSYTTQHITVLIMIPLILQTIIVVQMMSTGGKGVYNGHTLRFTMHHVYVGTTLLTSTR